MPIETLYAELLDAGVMPWQVRRLTFWQIAKIIRHERTEKGELKLREAAPEPEMERKAFAVAMRRRGLPDYQIEERWRAVCRRREAIRKRKGR